MEFDPSAQLNMTNAIGALIALVTGGGLLKLFESGVKWNDSRLRNKLPNVLKTVDKIYGAMHELLRNSPADRILLVICTNGGGIPSAGKPLYSTILREVSDQLSPAAAKWGKRMLDEQHTKVITEMLDVGRVQLITDKMPDGELKTLYMSEGIWGSDVVLLHKGKLGLHYLTVNYTHEPADANYMYEAKLDQAVSRLQELVPRID